MIEKYSYLRSVLKIGERKFADLFGIGYVDFNDVAPFINKIGGEIAAQKKSLRVILSSRKKVIAIGENSESECFNLLTGEFVNITDLYRELYTIQVV